MLNKFFYHNSTERKATFMLLLLLFLIWGAGWLWPLFAGSKKSNFSAFKQEVEAFETDLALAELAAEEEKEARFAAFKEGWDDDKPYRKYNKYKKEAAGDSLKKQGPPPEPFPFDPNSIAEQEMLALGLSARTAKSILNFREKGGKFRKKSDFGKVYTLDSVDYQRLLPFIQLPDSLEKKTFAEKPSNTREKAMPSIINVNNASAEDFQKLPGIGPSFAERIVKYRNSLGGFAKVEQIAEVYGLADSTYRKIAPYLTCPAGAIKKININTIQIEDLKSHPYLRWKHAKAIVKYREANGPYKSVEMLRTIHEFDDAEGTYWKIQPYLTL